MFKKKDQDVIHQTNIKRGITSHFSRTLKILQQRHLQSDSEEFIFSNDASNNLCNALEAVFLHGLKDSVTQKLTAYVGMATATDPSSTINFWNVAVKFTHSDVVTQLQKLAQINTDIGLCRAWVRLALNDGLMQSYLHSMMVDLKSMAYFYHSHSFLRDHEQPGILKNLLAGLMSLDFKLSYNSSVLNSWNNGTLQLIGFLDSHSALPPALQQSKGDQSGSSSIKDAVVQEKKEKSASKLPNEPIIASISEPTLTKSEPSLAEIHDKPMFSSIHDVEEIRRMANKKISGISQASYSVSEGSSSSHISCPDPSTNTLNQAGGTDIATRTKDSPIVSPALYPRPNANKEHKSLLDKYNMFGFSDDQDYFNASEESAKKGIDAHLHDSETEVKNQSLKNIEGNFGQSEAAMSPTRPRSRRVEEEDVSLSSSPSRPRSRRVTNEDLQYLSPKSFSPPDSLPKTCGVTYSLTEAEEDTTKLEREVKDSNDDNKIVYTPSSSPKRESHMHRDDWEQHHESRGRHRSRSSERHHHSLGHVKSEGGSHHSVESDSHAKSPFLSLHSSRTRLSSPGPEDSRSRSKSHEDLRPALPPVKLDAMEQEAILRKVLKGMDVQADKEREKRDSQEIYKGSDQKDTAEASKAENKSVTADKSMGVSESAQVKNGAGKLKSFDSVDSKKSMLDSSHKKPHSEEDLKHSQSKSSHDKGEKDKNSELEKKQRTQEKKDMTDQKPVDMEEDNEEEVDENVKEDEFSISGRFGNSLVGKTGWSGENDGTKSHKTRAESFATMLRTYAPATDQKAVSLDQVIETLPCDTSEDSVDGGGSRQGSSHTGSDLVQRQDSCLEEFEVLQSLSKTFCGQTDANSSRMVYLFRIPREHGLSHQNFTCRGCSRPIGIIYGQPRLCEFDGGLYCYECHENAESYIPSSIIYDWDFRKKKVCGDNFKFLQELEEQALYDVEELNPKLYKHVQELEELKLLRQQLCYLKSYLFTCSQKVAESLRQKIWPREHLYDRRDLYSLMDLLQVQSGTLQKLVKELVKYSSQHVYECVLCSQKGFVCEICRNPQVIYPFEVDTTVRCAKCKAVYHKTCMTESLPCPKCERWGRRVSSSSNINEDHPEDYGMSPPL